jgi:hypothetical protein
LDALVDLEPVLWALRWTATTAIGVDVERQYVVFGAAGAITVMALSGLLFERLRSSRRPREAAE